MGALPKEKAGVGSAMNDVLRELGGTLGVAVLGTLLASKYGDGMEGHVSTVSDPIASAGTDSVDTAHMAATQLSGDAATGLVSAADHAFVTAMGSTTDIAAAVALAGALIALLFLPSRGKQTAAVDVEAEQSADQDAELASIEPALV